MQSYRCLLLDDANAMFEWVEFTATNDHAADGQAAGLITYHSKAAGYSLWQGGRLVIEHRAMERAAPRSSPHRGMGG